MARIRTIKPEFFRHEALFEAEASSGLPLRIAFAGLWTVCDREGRFRWQPRVLKLDVMPFDEINFAAVLDALVACGFVVKYQVEGALFGHIPSWRKHQQVNVRESQSTLPAPDSDGATPIQTMEAHTPKHVHAHADSSGEGEGKGKGKGREGEKTRAPRSSAPEAPPDIPPQVWVDFLSLRRQKRAPLTDTALTAIREEAGRAGITLEAALRLCCKRGWQGFEAKWLEAQPWAKQTMTPDQVAAEAMAMMEKRDAQARAA